jgi:branched-chain amino acid transport system ATP-binding protein
MTAPVQDTALSTRGLTVKFGGVTALKDLSLSVPTGVVTGLIGPNGAGKSTFIDAVTGFLSGNATGSVMLGNRDVSALSAHRRAQHGLARTWQTGELFDDISVSENLAVAANRLTARSAIAEFLRVRRRDDRIDATLEMLGLAGIAHCEPRTLSPRDRKLVGVARAIVGRPAIALLDEPAAGLDRRETDWLGEKLTIIAESGIPVLLIDHDMRLVLGHCATVHVLNMGSLIASGTPVEIIADAEVIRAYLGSTAGRPQ